MLGLVELALELFEYKVGDLIADKSPIGGAKSVASLREFISQQKLSPEQDRFFKELRQKLNRYLQDKRQLTTYAPVTVPMPQASVGAVSPQASVSQPDFDVFMPPAKESQDFERRAVAAPQARVAQPKEVKGQHAAFGNELENSLKQKAQGNDIWGSFMSGEAIEQTGDGLERLELSEAATGSKGFQEDPAARPQSSQQASSATSASPSAKSPLAKSPLAKISKSSSTTSPAKNPPAKSPVIEANDIVVFDLDDDSDINEVPKTVEDEAQLLGPEEDYEIQSYLSPEERDEQEVEEYLEMTKLRRLASQVWIYDLGRALDKLAIIYRFEPGRHTVRIIYSTMRNLQAHVKKPYFAEDIELNHLEIVESLPDYDNVLVPLRRLEDIRSILQVFIETILSFKSKQSPFRELKLEEHEILIYLEKLMLRLAQNPYAGKKGLLNQKIPSSESIKEAIEVLERDIMGEAAKIAERQKLEAKLQQALAAEESQHSLFKRDLRTYYSAVKQLFNRLQGLLPVQVGGSVSLPNLSGPVLSAKTPCFYNHVYQHPEGLSLRLKSSQKFKFAGFDFAVIPTGYDWRLYCGDIDLKLESMTQISLDGRLIEIFVDMNYLHMRLVSQERPLEELLAESLLIYWMLQNKYRLELLRLLEFLSAESTANPELLAKALRVFVSLLRQSPNSHQNLIALSRAAVRQLKLELPETLINHFVGRVEGLVNISRYTLSKVASDFELADGSVNLYELKDVSSLSFYGESLKISKLSTLNKHYDMSNLMETGFALRTTLEIESDRTLVVMSPDGPVAIFEESLLYPLKKGYALLARSGNHLLGTYLAHPDNPT
ncbi:MAG: hypothetical protein R2880_07475 [Deinococcales bacterium]